MKQVTELHVKNMVDRSKTSWNETEGWMEIGSEMTCKTDELNKG
jgi:hypothetical protein